MIGKSLAAGAVATLLTGFTSAAHATVTISSKPTTNMSCAAGVCTPTADQAILNVSDLEHLIGQSDTKVLAKAMPLRIVAPLAWASTAQLTLDSPSIAIDQPITVQGTGGLVINTRHGNTKGAYVLERKGRVEFWDLGGRLAIDGNPYVLVKTVEQLSQSVSANPNGFYALAQNYDAAADGTYASSPVVELDGTFEGLGNAISNLTIADTLEDDNAALFTYLGSGFNTRTSVRDITLNNLRLTGSAGFNRMGGIAVNNFGTISNVHVHGRISSTSDIGAIASYNAGLVDHASAAVRETVIYVGGSGGSLGGLVAQNHGTVRDSFSTGAVSGDFQSDNVGGLVGYNQQGQIIDSWSSGNVKSATFSGGLVGYSDGIISGSFAKGNVTGDGGVNGGGLVGENLGMIKGSFALGSISNFENVGGLMGQNFGTASESFARGAVSNADISIGGLAGFNFGTLSQTYSTGSVTGGGSVEFGGLLGGDNPVLGTVDTSYWDTNTSGISDQSEGCGSPPSCPGVTGLSTAQFQSGLPSGFDPAVWAEDPNINNGYPYLLANPPPK